MNFGERLTAARKNAGMTQKQLADTVGLSLRTITNYETLGRYPKKHEIYQQLADVLHVNVNYLLSEGSVFLNPGSDEDTDTRGRLQAVLMEVDALFSGGELSPEDKDELMKGIQDAYWIARSKQAND